MLNIQDNVSLKGFTTFKVGGSARYFTVVKNINELREAIIFSKQNKVPFFILGGGSNVLISNESFSGLVIKNEIKNKVCLDTIPGFSLAIFSSGENWDEAVDYTVSKNLSGLENLSGIPGTVGASPVQNIGAYGQEIKNVLCSLKVMDMDTLEEEIFNNSDCYFSYRNSIFKRPENKRYIITEVSFLLKKDGQVNINYKDLQLYFLEKNNLKPSIKEVRTAVLEIRSKKFPNLNNIGCAGSFFKNPIITQEIFNNLKEKFPSLPGYAESNGNIKVPLAWILDNICGYKGKRNGKVGLYEKQPLILVNYSDATEKEISDFAKKIIKEVKQKINLDIEWEVEKIN